jgi:hypothetical protein
MFVKALDVLRLEVELSVSPQQFPLLVQNVVPGVDVLSPAYIYHLICVLLGVKFLPHGIYFAVQSVQREKPLHEGAQLNINYPYPALYVNREGYGYSARTALFYRRSLLIYLDQPEWLNHFQYSRAAADPSLRRIERVKLMPMQARYVYAEGSLLPSDLMPYVDDPIQISLPRFVDGNRWFWGDYTVLRRRSLFMSRGWIDPSSPSWCGAYRGVFWLNFVE